MKKLLAILALSLAMVACGEKQEATSSESNPAPIEAVEETVVEQVSPATPEEIKAAEAAAGDAPVEAIEETVEEQVQNVAPTTPETKVAQ